MNGSIWFGSLTVVPFLVLPLVVGCGDPPATDDGSSSAAASRAVVAAPAPAGPPFRTVWEAHYLQGSKVGYGRTTYYRETLDDKPVVRIVSEAVLTVLRFGQPFEQKYRDVSWETEAGEVLRFESQAELGDAPQTTIGTVTGERAEIVLRSLGKVTNASIEWPRGTGGSTAVIESLRRTPLKPGEARTVAGFLPMFNHVATITLAARGPETTDVDGVNRELLRIEGKTTVAGAPAFEMILWADDQGEVWRLELPVIHQTTVRTTEERAKAKATTDPVDLGRSTLVAVAPPLENAHQSRMIRYRVRLTDGNPAASFPAGEGQSVRKLDDGSAEITVTAVRPDTPLPPGFAPTPPTDRERRPNAVVQSDDAEVQKLAAAAAPGESDPWKIAVALEDLIRQKMNADAFGAGFDFSQAFASAAETARSLRGDCTEHAVLLCAVLRARNIPARTVMGLVYVPKAQAFGYHLWTEAWINDRWIPLDATVGQGGTSAAYLKLTDAHLDGVDSFTAFLPLLQIVGRLKIEVPERR